MTNQNASRRLETPVSRSLYERISVLTVCGLEELDGHRARGVTHVLSLLDPGWPEPESFASYDLHHRTTLHFHDVIAPRGEMVTPRSEDVEAILNFGRAIVDDGLREHSHLLVHCHAGVSRSTAAMAMLLAQAAPSASETRVFERLLKLRPQAWPNSLMIAFADEQLQRQGRLTAALYRLYAHQLARRPELDVLMREFGRAREVDAASDAGA
jgi:predicted protein tyrosine phosphatase